MASTALANSRLRDEKWIARGEERLPAPQFLLWLAPWCVLLAVGVYAAGALPVLRVEPDQHG